MCADFHGYGSLTEWQQCTCTHLCNRARWWAFIFQCSWCGTYSTYTIFSTERVQSSIKINYFWRSASLHCNIVCKILLPSTSLKTNTHVLVKVEFLTVLAFSRLERIMRCLWVQSGLSWSYQVRSEWPVVPLLLDSRHELQQTAESAASSWLTCPVKTNQVLLNSNHTLDIWPPWAW